MTPYEQLLRPQESLPPVQEDVVKVQARVDWLASAETQRLVKTLTKEINQLMSDAIGLARVNHQSENSKQIVHKLIEADTLRKVVENYATRI